MRTIYFKKIFPLLLSAILLCSMGLTAKAAQEMPDVDRIGSISVTMQDSDSGESVPGGTLTLYKAGDILVKNGFSFVLTDAFAGSRLDLSDVKSSELAEKLAAYATEQNLSGTSVEADENGEVTFSDLETGLYLVVQTAAPEGWYAVSPFLVSVPNKGESGYVYDVNATPKMEAITAVPETPENPAEPAEEKPSGEKMSAGRLPQTGQLNWPIPVMAILGVLLFAAGWDLCYAKRRREYEA